MNFSDKILLAFRHPLRFIDKVSDKLKLKLFPVPNKPVLMSINGVNFYCDFSLDRVVPKMYLGMCEKDIIRIMKQYLKEGDIAIDVGANIGYLTANMASLVGKTGQVHSFEPVPKYNKFLEKLVEINKDYNIIINKCALGDSECKATIQTSKINIGWNTIVPDFMPEDDIEENIEIEVNRLDSYLRKKEIEKVSLIKIDTEGFEYRVLKGLSGYFEDNPANRPPIIVEIAPEGNRKMGIDLKDIEEYMFRYSYRAYSIYERELFDIKSISETSDIIFLHNPQPEGSAGA